MSEQNAVYQKVKDLQKFEGMVSIQALLNDPTLVNVAVEKAFKQLMREGSLIEVTEGYVRTDKVEPEETGIDSLPWEQRIPKTIKKDYVGNPLPPEPYWFTPANYDNIYYNNIMQALTESGSYKTVIDDYKYFYIRGGLARRPIH